MTAAWTYLVIIPALNLVAIVGAYYLALRWLNLD